MNTRRHNTAKRWAPGASFLLATALLLLVLSPGAHAATLNSTQSDAVFWLLREMQDEARAATSAIASQDLAREESVSHDASEVLLASTRDIENAAQHLFASGKSGVSPLRFASQTARDLSVHIAPREVSSSHETVSHHLAHHLTAASLATFARISQVAPRVFLPLALREYSRHAHLVAHLSGVRSNSFPQ